MDIKVTSRLPASAENACHLVFLFNDGKLHGSARKIDSQSRGLIKALIDSGDFSADTAETSLLQGLAGTPATRVMLVGLGERDRVNATVWRDATLSAARALNSCNADCLLSDCLTAVKIDELSPAEMMECLACQLVNAAYIFNLHPRSKNPTARSLRRGVFCIDKKHNAEVSAGARRGLATGHGMSMAKDLGNLAPNICTPSYLAETAEKLADRYTRMTSNIIDESDMESLGMGALLAVSRGSSQPAQLIIMNYRGRSRAGSPIVLIGKGVTFDTGGISMKSSESMDEMKFDMCGAASVFGTMQAVAELDLELNVIGIVAAAENMPDGNATRPGDVVESMSGQSIEILNTDAEGRLVLGDALTYAGQFKPATVIDIATLTGACVVALGDAASAVMGNDQATVDKLVAAGNHSGDRCWQLPIWDEYQKQLDSNFADMANIGGRSAGAITAGCFLSRFAEDYRWAHLDIAGVAWHKGINKGASGRPVPLLMQFLLSHL